MPLYPNSKAKAKSRLGKCSDAGAHAWTTSLTYSTRKRNSRFVERLEEQMRLLFNIPCIQPVQQEITTHIMRIHRLIETFEATLWQKIWFTPLISDNSN
jgi:hypothetical protein